MTVRFYRFIGMIVFILMLTSCAEPITQNQNSDVRHPGMVLVPGGMLSMGGDNNQAEANEFPKHMVKIDSFYMDETEVTNAQFKEFVDATGYVTIAEQPIDWDELKKQLPPDTPKPQDSELVPGALVFQYTDHPVSLQGPQVWWKWTQGANWKKPQGPDSNIKEMMDHPVVHVAWDDAVAYCQWIGKRLPTEAEWEWAARGGLQDKVYPWGDESINEGKYKANFYQGIFPYQNTAADGFELTAPVMSFAPNGYGLYDMSGNVWEWCADWFDHYYYKRKSAKVSLPNGPDKPNNPSRPMQPERVIRGGSFLCNDSYCSGYRNARRMGSTADTGLCHTGFRCVIN